jgi:hypothetical protein
MTTVKYNFVIDSKDSELKNYINLQWEEAAKTFTRGDLNWCLQCYLILSKRNQLNIQCSNSLNQNAINLLHSDQLLKIKGKPNQFIVCIRADYPKRYWAHYHIVQNKNQLCSNTSFVPHWVQPGLIARNPIRQKILRVAYSGQTFNGNLASDEDTWKKLFESYGIEFVTLTAGFWHDLSCIDVLIGIRSFDKKPHDTKPPTKLFSAWHSRIPFIGGYDSAFMQVGTPGEDYLLAKTPEDVVAAVLKLRDDHNLYEKLVKNGLAKAALYNENAIAETWENILLGPVTKRYEQWKFRPTYEKIRFDILLKAGLLEHQSKQVMKKLLK